MAAREAAATQASSPDSRVASPAVATTRVVLAAIALSGFAAMVYEVAWSRILAMILGSGGSLGRGPCGRAAVGQ